MTLHTPTDSMGIDGFDSIEVDGQIYHFTIMPMELKSSAFQVTLNGTKLSAYIGRSEHQYRDASSFAMTWLRNNVQSEGITSPSALYQTWEDAKNGVRQELVRRLFRFSIPRIGKEQLETAIQPGDMTFIVGANGSGKTQMLLHINSNHIGGSSRLIPANRHVWIENQNIPRNVSTPRHRHQNQLSIEGTTGEQPIFQCLTQIVGNHMNQILEGHKAAKIGDGDEAVKIAQTPTVFDQIGALMLIAGMNLSFDYNPGHHSQNEIAFLNVSKIADTSHHQFISPQQMSDGERSAFVLAARVLTADTGATILIDEPERHLHRAITERLIAALVKERPDCSFIISTHDPALPMNYPDSSVIITRQYAPAGPTGPEWEAMTLNSSIDMPEDVRRALLGGRRKILVTEGSSDSLDARLYSILFPDHLIYPAGSCEDVIRVVNGIESSNNHHDIESIGVIDRDTRSQNEVDRLAKRKIYAIDGYAIESLYYCPTAIRAVARWQAKSFVDTNESSLVQSAKGAGAIAFQKGEIVEQMAAIVCEAKVRRAMQDAMPKAHEIRNGLERIEIPQIDLQKELKRNMGEFSQLARDVEEGVDKIIKNYPIKKTGAPRDIARALRLNSQRDYEANFLARVKRDPKLKEDLLRMIGAPT